MTYDTRKISHEVSMHWEMFMRLGKLGWFTVHFFYAKGAQL